MATEPTSRRQRAARDTEILRQLNNTLASNPGVLRTAAELAQPVFDAMFVAGVMPPLQMTAHQRSDWLAAGLRVLQTRGLIEAVQYAGNYGDHSAGWIIARHHQDTAANTPPLAPSLGWCGPWCEPVPDADRPALPGKHLAALDLLIPVLSPTLAESLRAIRAHLTGQ